MLHHERRGASHAFFPISRRICFDCSEVNISAQLPRTHVLLGTIRTSFADMSIEIQSAMGLGQHLSGISFGDFLLAVLRTMAMDMTDIVDHSTSAHQPTYRK